MEKKEDETVKKRKKSWAEKNERMKEGTARK
jgi:hypothetical protein